MTDTNWAAKVLEGVPRFQTMSGNMLPYADVLAAIAKLTDGDGLVGLLGRANEELRMLRAKDTGAVYDVTLRLDLAAALAKIKEQTP